MTSQESTLGKTKWELTKQHHLTSHRNYCVGTKHIASGICYQSIATVEAQLDGN